MSERMGYLTHELLAGIIPNDFEEIIYMIRRAEYKRGKADGVSETDKSWRETLDILNDDRTMEGIKKSLQEIKEGKTIPLSELDSANVHPTKGCGKTIMVRDGKSQHQSFCGCTYKGLHLCDACTVQEASK